MARYLAPAPPPTILSDDDPAGTFEPISTDGRVTPFTSGPGRAHS